MEKISATKKLDTQPFLCHHEQMNYHNTWFYHLTAFVGGLAIMAVEMTATRMMSPYFGTSIFIWTNVIGIIMAALALGYWLGGKIADRYPNPKVFFTMIIVTSLVMLILPFIGPALLKQISLLLVTTINAEKLIWTSLLGTLILFFPPFVLLGLISPYLVRLISRTVEKTGKSAGNVFAMSTIGSIAGTFLPTFVTVPLIGVKRTIIIFGAALCLIGAIGLGRKATYALLPIFAGAIFFSSPFMLAGDHIIAQTESPYNYIEVYQDKDQIKYLTFSEAYTVQSRFDPTNVLNDGHYWDYFSIFPPLYSEKEASAAIIGNAGGTIPRLLYQYYPALKIDAVELDPSVSAMAQEHFSPFPPSVNLHHADGRVFLQQVKDDYQMIFIDAFKEVAVPAHLSSQEFFQLTKERLAPEGLMALNINSTGSENEIYQRMIVTLQKTYDSVYDLKIPGAYNHLIVATDRSTPLPDDLRQIDPPAGLTKYFDYASAQMTVPSPLAARMITDDQPLTEIIFDTMILRELIKIKS